MAEEISSHKIFSADERLILINLIKDNPIIEDKRTDVISVARKRAAWEEIQRQFNSNIAVSKRTLAQLKKCWDNIKTKRKKDMAKEMRELMKTGGGPAPPKTSPVPELELAVPHLGHNMGFWYDSDAVAVRPSPDLSTPLVQVLLPAVAAGSSSSAQDSNAQQNIPAASSSSQDSNAQQNIPAASSSPQDQSYTEAVDATPAEEAPAVTSPPQAAMRKQPMRQSLADKELEARLKRHKLQLESDLKLQQLREKELQLLIEAAKEKVSTAKKEEERREQAFQWEEERKKQAFQWEEERKKQAFQWEEERKRRAFEAEERRKEEIHTLQLKK